MTLLLFVVGLGALAGGAELLLRGAVRLAAAVGVSPLVIGLTVVAFGTSAPELAVSVKSGLAGQADLSIGNVVGSNIFNILVILGLPALIAPLTVAHQLLRFDIWLMIGVSGLLYALSLDGSVGRAEGVLLAAGLLAYVVWSIRQSRRESAELQREYAEEYATPAARSSSWVANVALVLVGLALLVIGSKWLVDGAVALARTLGVSELVIGLTIVAGGTSLPEVAASLVAALRGQRDIAVGNVVGSNIFNILCVLGVTAVVTPGGIRVATGALHFDMPVMIAVAVACLPVFFTGYRISRWEGALFLAYYLAYTAYLVMDATHHAALAPFTTAMTWYVLPLTVVTLAVLTVRSLRRPEVSGGAVVD